MRSTTVQSKRPLPRTMARARNLTTPPPSKAADEFANPTRFVEVEIAAALGPTPQAKEVERAEEPRGAITPAGACGPRLHFAAASASASVR